MLANETVIFFVLFCFGKIKLFLWEKKKKLATLLLKKRQVQERDPLKYIELITESAAYAIKINAIRICD